MNDKLKKIIRPNNRDWLVKDRWFDEEAACLFAQIEPNKYIERCNHEIYIENIKAKKILLIIKTWSRFGNRCFAHPFWYLNKTFEKGMRHYIDEKLITDFKKMYDEFSDKNKEKFVKDYSELTNILNLKISGQAVVNTGPPESQIKHEVKASTQIKKNIPIKANRKKCPILLDYVEFYVKKGMTCDDYIKMMEDKKYIDNGNKFVPSKCNTDDSHPHVRRVYLKLSYTKGGKQKYDIYYQSFYPDNGANYLGIQKHKSHRELRDYFAHARETVTPM